LWVSSSLTDTPSVRVNHWQLTGHALLIQSQYADNETGEPLGYIAEEPKDFFAVLARQAFATHRPFRAVIMDVEGSPIMWACIATPSIYATDSSFDIPDS